MDLQSFHGRRYDLRVIGQAQVIVGTEVQDVALRDADFGTLGTQQLPLGFIETFCADIGQLLVNNVFERGVCHEAYPIGLRLRE
jgi:hypothetical protein